MVDLSEILIISEASGSLGTCCAWDPKSGSNLRSYKGGGVASRVIKFTLQGFLLILLFKSKVHTHYHSSKMTLLLLEIVLSQHCTFGR